jgi:mono/diheme cytochrome c family protein
MAKIQILGLFHQPEQVAETIEQLRRLGVTDENITVMSNAPYRPEMLGRPRPPRRVGIIALIGAGLGLITGLLLTVGIFLLYPLRTGGQPIVPVPPTLIVLFEVTMLGTMWGSFFGLMGTNRFPIFKSQSYDPHITEGHLGVVAQVDETLLDQVQDAFKANGAHHMNTDAVDSRRDFRPALFWIAVLSVVALVGAGLLLLSYDIIRIPFPTNMANQDSIAYLQGPRLAAPVAAVPVQGPELIAGQPASVPVPASADSLQRGKALFRMVCAVCHGQSGNGTSPLSGFFPTKPADLTGDTVQSLSDNEIFLVITQGFNSMPSMAENLSPGERWDVINYIRTLKK